MTASADFHLHSSCSDGVLSPAGLVRHVAAHGVADMALTDHDTLAGCAAAADEALLAGLRFRAGVEVSCTWRGQSIHIIGLAPDLQDAPLRNHLESIQRLRRERLDAIGERLGRRASLPGAELVASAAAGTVAPTRMHLARALVKAGHARDTADAFERWLARGRPGHAPVVWPDLAATVQVLRAAGAVTVLAHAHRYRLSAGALRALLDEYAALRGDALEVSIGGMSRNDLDRLATLARTYRLAASTGSDFHDPAVPWNTPGRFAKLPADLEPVSKRLAA